MAELVDVELEIRIDVAEKKAIAFADGSMTTDDNGRKVVKLIWLPRSLIEVYHDQGKTVTVTMPEWLALDKGLI